MRVFVSSTVLALLLFAPVVQFASAGEPSATTSTPSPTETQTPLVAPTFVDLRIDLQGARVAWSVVPGAASYRLTGEFTAVEVNASNPCLPTQDGTNESRTITLDETLPTASSFFDLPLPVLPPQDEWLVSATSMEIQALDVAGGVVGTSRGLFVSEGCREARPSPVIQLPPTGLAPTSGDEGSRYAWAATALGGTLFLLAYAARRIRQ